MHRTVQRQKKRIAPTHSRALPRLHRSRQLTVLSASSFAGEVNPIIWLKNVEISHAGAFLSWLEAVILTEVDLARTPSTPLRPPVRDRTVGGATLLGTKAEIPGNSTATNTESFMVSKQAVGVSWVWKLRKKSVGVVSVSELMRDGNVNHVLES